MKRRKELAALSEAQMEIMQQVWAGGEVTVTQVWEALNHQRPLARNTIHTLMERLVRKGWLARRLKGQRHYYAAVPDRATTLRDVVNRLVNSAFSGSAEGLVLALLQGRELKTDEATRIRQMIEKAKREDS
jgi:BlaI family penicillinase repressor